MTSATGGYLAPSGTPPLDGQALLDFLQGVIVGITGMDGTLVRPAFQIESPNLPDAGNAWCAFRITRRAPDTYAVVTHNADGKGSDTMQRQERLHALLSFYDQGVGGHADELAARFRDGIAIPQNREALQRANFAHVKTGEVTVVPSLLKVRWLYRVDLEWIVTRQIDRTYAVLTVVSAHSTLVTDDGMTREINVQTP